MFLICLILPTILGCGVYSASNRYDYQKQKNNVSGERAWPMHKADNLTAIGCAVSLDNMGSSTYHNPESLHSLLQEQLYLLTLNPKTE
jgi:hypothetical protein